MSEPKNEYEPWKSHGQTEVEYFRARHIEQSAEIGRLQRRLGRFEHAARATVEWFHRGTTADQPYFVTRLEEALACDGKEA